MLWFFLTDFFSSLHEGCDLVRRDTVRYSKVGSHWSTLDISYNQLQESFMSLLYNTINQTAHEAAISDIWISDTLLLFGSVHTSFMSLLYHFCEESFCVDSTFVVSQLLFIFTLINNTERWKLQFSFLFFAKETFSALFSLQL